MTNQLAAVRIYLVGEAEAFDAFVAKPPDPWHSKEPVRCKIALPNATALTDAWAAEFWTEMANPRSLITLHRSLLKALGDARVKWWMVEDIARLKAERKTIEKMERGLAERAKQKSKP